MKALDQVIRQESAREAALASEITALEQRLAALQQVRCGMGWDVECARGGRGELRLAALQQVR
jgi:hypothetical protein